jgi:hypothetical protein
MTAFRSIHYVRAARRAVFAGLAAGLLAVAALLTARLSYAQHEIPPAPEEPSFADERPGWLRGTADLLLSSRHRWQPENDSMDQPDERMVDSVDPRSPSDAPTYGAEPADAGLQFLRQSTVLLAPGQTQFDYGVIYTWQENGFPVLLSDQTLDQAHLRSRSLLVPFGLRYGLTERAQAFVNVPVGWGHAELADREQHDAHATGGVGDVLFGANFLLREGFCGAADIVGTFGAIAPTGEHPFGPLPTASTGVGFWSVYGELLVIHTLDPAVVFWGVGYRHHFERELSGRRIQLGEEISYQVGSGFAINDRVTFSSALLGSVFTDTRVDDRILPGSVLDPMRVRMAVTVLAPCRRIIEPFVMFAITPDAPDAEIGVIITHY